MQNLISIIGFLVTTCRGFTNFCCALLNMWLQRAEHVGQYKSPYFWGHFNTFQTRTGRGSSITDSYLSDSATAQSEQEREVVTVQPECENLSLIMMRKLMGRKLEFLKENSIMVGYRLQYQCNMDPDMGIGCGYVPKGMSICQNN